MPHPSGRLFQTTAGKGLGYVEQAEEHERDEAVSPVGGASEQGDPLAGNLVDDDKSRIVAAGFPGGNGCGGNAERDGEDDADDQGREKAGGDGWRKPA